MWLFDKLKETVNSVATNRTKINSTRSLQAILKAVDFNVYRYRSKTGTILTGPRWGQQEQRHLTDSSVIDLEWGYKLYAFNIDQLLNKLNGKFQETLNDPNWNPFPFNIYNFPNLIVDKTKRSKKDELIPDEVISDLGIKVTNWMYTSNKSGYAWYITLDWKLVPLRKTRYANISIKGSASKKTIYREFRDWSLDESFVKVVGEYIISTVVDKDGTALVDIDIEPSNYVVQTEKSWDDEKDITQSEVLSTLGQEVEFDTNSEFDSNELELTPETVFDYFWEWLSDWLSVKWIYDNLTEWRVVKKWSDDEIEEFLNLVDSSEGWSDSEVNSILSYFR